VREELFFRGALATALGPRRGDAFAVLVYGAVTVATLNLALVVAATVLGSMLAAERRLSGGVLAPVVTHLTWSTLVILFLPR
jgi:CAAX protease family protein